MTDACVFIGPSLPPGPWPAGVERLPPAALGDVYRLAARAAPPAVIGLVDGYFERLPPVRHKEILFALGRDIRVLGAASIGALRAAELHGLGMEGVGAIFAGYRDGHFHGAPLEGDDEVAVLHGPAELGYPPVTLALVDLRAAAADAVAADRLAPAEADELLRAARALHFKDRSPARLLAALAPALRERCAALLPARGAGRKQTDAALLLARVAALALEPPAPPRPEARAAFRPDDAWLDFIDWATTDEPASAAARAELQLALALDPALRRRAEREALLQLLARRDAVRRGRRVDEAGADPAVADLLDLYGPAIAGRLRAALAALGALDGVEAGVRRRRLARRALEAGAQPPETQPERLLAWHFARLGEAPPVDLEAYVQGLGLARGDLFLRALEEERAAIAGAIAAGPTAQD